MCWRNSQGGHGLKKIREAKDGELSEIHILETLEKFSKRPETRIDMRRLLDGLTPSAHIYAKHLVMSGPSSLAAAAKTCGLRVEEVESAIKELEVGIAKIRKN